MPTRVIGKKPINTQRCFALALLLASYYSFFLNLNLGSLTKYHTEIIVDYPDSRSSVPSFLRQFDEKYNDGTFMDDPFLVVCHNVGDVLLPMFSNFTVIRLGKEDDPPPWNATVFLYGEQCADHPYVAESIERRRRSPFLVAPKLPPSSEQSKQIHGVNWPNFSVNSTKYLRIIRERPAIIKIMGEVFWRSHYAKQSCRDVDFIIYREDETLIPDCLTIHYLQGVSTTTMRGEDGQFGFHNTSKILQKEVAHPHKPDEVKYDKFCSFIVRFNSTHPTEMFQSTMYDIDAIIRHMFFLQLSEYNQCERITECPGNPYTAFECMVGYKFHITMENSLVDGYVSEKLFNGALAGGIPIYFGASDIGKYVNKNSFIHCDVSRNVIEEMRSFYPRGQKPRPFLFTNSSRRPTDEELISWADSYLRPQLEPCVKRVIELDKNDNEYLRVLNEPFLLNNDIMSGVYPLRGVAVAYNLLRSSEISDDFITVPSDLN